MTESNESNANKASIQNDEVTRNKACNKDSAHKDSAHNDLGTDHNNESGFESNTVSFAFKPYKNDHQSLQIAELVFENQTDKIIAYGDIEITKTEQGLYDALKLQKLFNLIVDELQSSKSKGEFVSLKPKNDGLNESEQRNKKVDNPFS